MEISPLQSIRIFGFWQSQPRQFIKWKDILEHNLTWKHLRNAIGLQASDLKALQPDKDEWIRRGGVTLFDLPDMKVFPVNPFTDLKADLAEVWAMRWSADTMAEIGITYEQMLSRGLSADIMARLQMPLSSWQALQMKTEHLEKLSDGDVQRIFHLPRAEVLLIFEEYTAE